MRRYDMDWLRVLVFGLLILYHVGMFFVPWGWHIKNNDIYGWLRYPMLFLNQWRLPILFVISGMGTYYALNKRSGKQFALERFVRLYIPLAVGMLLIVPPQVYFERLANGQFQGGYLDFWPSRAFIGIYAEGNFSWHHLWFLPYLFLFSLILIPAFLKLRNNPDNGLLRWIRRQMNKPFGLFWLIIPLYLAEAFLEPFFPVTHALVGDWFTLVFYVFLFFYGFLLMASRNNFWEIAAQRRRLFLKCGIVGFTVWLATILTFEDSTVRHFTEAFLKVFNLWSWILAIFGYGARYLNKPSKLLAYCNEAVYPFYILHQTVTISIGYYLMDLNWGFVPKFLVLTLGTFGISWILYEFGIRRWRAIRPLFGLKVRPKKYDQVGVLTKEAS
ncbi:acyltransferase family protein [Poritiphilus flavus]|uniref:Acyltransferase family protein n=1 Tax=Poritiphilus flavus TaxID=2697053 RepID=A0A6L9ECH4_9FLAO|nr:acyltransferase family protein [Poritiphilus flavus]NAS12454.1 acyltransferase family protein [Poritiphilus flavus]